MIDTGRTAFIPLSPCGVLAIFLSGAFTSAALEHGSLVGLSLAVALFVTAWVDAHSPFASGQYKRSLLWRRVGEAT